MAFFVTTAPRVILRRDSFYEKGRASESASEERAGAKYAFTRHYL